MLVFKQPNCQAKDKVEERDQCNYIGIGRANFALVDTIAYGMHNHNAQSGIRAPQTPLA